MRNNVDVTHLLRVAGADANAADINGRTPLYEAVRNTPSVAGRIAAGGPS